MPAHWRVAQTLHPFEEARQGMPRTFRQEFHPSSDNPVTTPEAEFTVQDIEDAGLREVLQTPGATFGSWGILGPLLRPGDQTPFIFREPLGRAREVKVALSGLFGRFVARAYLHKYCQLSFFAHVAYPTMMLDSRHQIQIVKLQARGDLPDWIACATTSTTNLPDLAVVEAKGSHAPSGPDEALHRAWNQACRIDVEAGGCRVSVKRFAIATRWGMASGGPLEPCISVRDPIDKGDPIKRDDKSAALVGVVRHHVANMLTPLGHAALARAIRDLTTKRVETHYIRAVERARVLLSNASTRRIAGDSQPLIGGTVTRAGPLDVTDVSKADLTTLARLDLRPLFVGLELGLVKAAIEGESIFEILADRPPAANGARSDGAGCWIVPLGGDHG